MFDSVLNTKHAFDKLSFRSYFKVNAFLRIAVFWFFSQRNPYTAKAMHCKTENDIRKYYH